MAVTMFLGGNVVAGSHGLLLKLMPRLSVRRREHRLGLSEWALMIRFSSLAPASCRRPPSTGAPPSSKRRRSAQPVSTLTPYNDTWTIKARVAKKEALRTWEKDGSSKSVFSMELIDDQVCRMPLLPDQAATSSYLHARCAA